MHILLLEDNPLIGGGIQKGLGKLGFSVDWYTDGLAGCDAFASSRYDAVVLDLSLPGVDGLDILQYWRGAGLDVPILILTARDSLEQRIMGLNLGADDYLCKPCALEELIARLHALTRRCHRSGETLSHGAVTLHTGTRSVTVNNHSVSLSPKEVQLVELFLLNKDRVLSTRSIEEKIYPMGEEVSSNAVGVHIHHIRRKLGNGVITTVHGIGYRLGEPE